MAFKTGRQRKKVMAELKNGKRYGRIPTKDLTDKQLRDRIQTLTPKGKHASRAEWGSVIEYEAELKRRKRKNINKGTQVFIKRKDGRPFADTGDLVDMTKDKIKIKDFETGEVVSYDRSVFFAAKPIRKAK